MRLLHRSLWAALALTAAVALPSAAAEEAFDLKFDINLTNDVTALLKPGDRLIATLQPQVQYGARTAMGTAMNVERVWEAGMKFDTITFKNAVGADQIYRLELRVVRSDKNGRAVETRYLSALDKTRRLPVNQAIALRLQRADGNDARDNNLFLVRDSDGVYRVMMFFA